MVFLFTIAIEKILLNVIAKSTNKVKEKDVATYHF